MSRLLHVEQDGSNRKHVASVIIERTRYFMVVFEYFRRDVTRCSAFLEEILIDVDERRESKINDFDLLVLFKQNVLRL